MQILDRVRINFFRFIIKNRFLLLDIGDRDKNYYTLTADILFTALKSAILNTNIKILLKTLEIKILKRDLFRDLIFIEKSLYSLYAVSEKIRNIKIKLVYLPEKNLKLREL